VNFLFLGSSILGQETPSVLGVTFLDPLSFEYSQQTTLILLGTSFAVITTLRFGLLTVYSYLGVQWSRILTGNLHKQVMDGVISARLQLFSEVPIGEILYGLVSAPRGAEEAVDNVVSGISSILMILVVGLTLSLVSPWLILIAAVVGFLYFGTIVLPTRERVRRYQQLRYECESRGTEISGDVINGIRDIRVVAAEAKWVAAFADEVDQWEAANGRAKFHSSLPAPTLQAGLLILFAALAVLAALVLSPEGLATRLPVLGVFAYGVLRVYPAVSQLGGNWVGLAHALPFLQAAEEWTEYPRDTLAAGTVQAPHLRKGIWFQGVSFSYDGHVPALDSVEFHIEAGKTTALVGASGVGKSTLIDLMLKFRLPGEGTIWLDDDDLASVVRQSWLDHIGFVGQDTFFFAGTIKANLLAWQPHASEEEMRSACQQAALLAFIDSLRGGLDTVIGERGITVSAGQRQRLAIARALLRKPDILILDEATSSLDGETESQVLELLFNGSMSRTTVVISHRLATVRNADHIIVIDKGLVIAQGTHEDLLASHGRYWELFLSQEASKLGTTSEATRRAEG
jgi:ABC-type multidrug transport system fused ATPase/permease subunit